MHGRVKGSNEIKSDSLHTLIPLFVDSHIKLTIPTGQITRTATGRLENFQASRFLDFDVVSEMVRRLAANETAAIGPGMILFACAGYPIATAWLLFTATRMILGWQYEQRSGTPPAVHPLDKS